MGALKLTYRTTKPTLKVVHSNLYENKKNRLSSSIYGFNGQEKDEEVKGQGNSYDYGMRMLDVRLGRWLSLDVYMYLYPNTSSYSFAGNNPIYIIDAAGEKLKVSDASNSGLVEKFKTLIEKSFSGKVIAKVSKDGMVTFHQIPNTELTEFESNAFSILKDDVESAEEIALFNLIDKNTGGENVTFDNFFSQEVDIDDIAALGIEQEGGTSLGALVYVATEYIGKAQDEAAENIQLNEDTPSNREDYYNPNHNIGSANESKVQKLQSKSSTQLGIGTRKVIRDNTTATYVNKVLFFDGDNTRFIAVRYTITNNNIDRIEQFELDDNGNIIEATGIVNNSIDISTNTNSEEK